MLIFLSGVSIDAVKRYHKIYPENKVNVLLSYFDISKSDILMATKYRHLVNKLMLDSGVFTLNSNKAKYASIINMQSYKKFLKYSGSLFDYYYNFDENFSDNGFGKNLQNQIELERCGYNPVPVIHNMRSIQEYEFYVEEGYPIVSIGSNNLKNVALDTLQKYVQRFYDNKVKVHLLGSTKFMNLAYAPSYSCDSSTWSRYAMKNSIIFWNPKKYGKRNKTDYIDFDTSYHGRFYYKNYPNLNALRKYLNEELGFQMRDMVGNANSTNRIVANVHHFYKVEQMVNKLHQIQGFNLLS
jgi:hypothetical protein